MLAHASSWEQLKEISFHLNIFGSFWWKFWKYFWSRFIDAHRGGGRGSRGAPHVPPIKIFEKFPHKNAIKHTHPLIFSQPQVPPSKEFAKKNHRTPPPGFPTTVHLCPGYPGWETLTYKIVFKHFFFIEGNRKCPSVPRRGGQLPSELRRKRSEQIRNVSRVPTAGHGKRGHLHGHRPLQRIRQHSILFLFDVQFKLL